MIGKIDSKKIPEIAKKFAHLTQSFLPALGSQEIVEDYFNKFNEANEFNTFINLIPYCHAFKKMKDYPACYAKLLMLFSIIEKLYGTKYASFDEWITKKDNQDVVAEILDQFSSKEDWNSKCQLLEELKEKYYVEYSGMRTVQKFFKKMLTSKEKITLITKIKYLHENVRENGEEGAEVLERTHQALCFVLNKCKIRTIGCRGEQHPNFCQIRKDDEILNKYLKEFIADILVKMRNNFVHEAITPAIVPLKAGTTEAFLMYVHNSKSILGELTDEYLDNFLDSKIKLLLDHYLSERT